MRKHEMEIEIDATVDRVWEAVSTAHGLASWFAPCAEVEPGAGGKVVLKWGPGMEATPQIEIWEPDRHLRTASDRPAPAPPNVVDYLLEGRGGTTVLRLVHSGFGDAADFNDEYDSTGAAWPVFLQMMKHSVQRGVARCRNVTVFRILEEPADSAWEKLMQRIDGAVNGAVRHFDPVGHCGCYEAPNGAMLSIFCEKCGGVTAITVVNLLYDVSTAEAESVRERWSGILNQTYGGEK
jgi:uncharacterized protein YndB with AHSA1/START domain